MTIAHPRRLRAERTLPHALRDALRELPNAPPNAAQLGELRQKLGLVEVASPAPVRPAATTDRRLKERRLRRTVVALVFFPVAATAAVGTVIELNERSERSAAAASSAIAMTRNRTLSGVTKRVQPIVDAVPPAAATLVIAPENQASLPTSSDTAANLARQPRSTPTPLASKHVAPAPRTVDTEAGRATEIELLQRANAALKSDPAQAQLLAAEHRQLFPAGNLAQERYAIAIKALVALGDSARARESLARFERAYPHSAYALELRQIVR